MTDSKKPYRKHRERSTQRTRLYVPERRDLQILESVYQHRFLTMSLLNILYPPMPAEAGSPPIPLRKEGNPPVKGTHLYKPLRRLFDHGYLDRLRPNVGGEFIYTITGDGIHVLRHKSDQVFFLPKRTDWLEWRNQKVSGLHIYHELMIARFRIFLEEALAQTAEWELLAWEKGNRENAARWRYKNKSFVLIPDAIFTLKNTTVASGGRRSFFLEADQGTMTHKRMAQKLSKYSRLYLDDIHRRHFEFPAFRVLTVTVNPHRVQNLLKTATKSKLIPSSHNPFFYFAEEAAYSEASSNLLAQIWQRPDSPDARFPIVPNPLPLV